MVILIVGENEYGCRRRLSSVLDDDQKTVVDASELNGLDSVIEKLHGGSLFGDEETMVVKYLKDAKGLHDGFIKLVKDVPESSKLVIYLSGVKSTDALVKKLIDVVDSNYVESNLSEFDLVKWVVDEVGVRGGSINTATARELVEWAGEEQLMLSGEIDKLIAFDPNITKQTIHEISTASPRSTIFQMLDAMLRGNSQKALEYLKDLRTQQYDNNYILSMICWQASAMTVASTAKSQSDLSSVARASGISPFVLKKAYEAVKKLRKSEIRKMNEYILDADYKLKNVPVNQEHLVVNLINRIAFIYSS